MIREPIPSPEPIEPHMIDRRAIEQDGWREAATPPRHRGVSQAAIAKYRQDVVGDITSVWTLAQLLLIHYDTAVAWLADGRIPLRTITIDRTLFVYTVEADAWMDADGEAA